MRNSSDITICDMFCGAGGSSTGAVQAGATVKIAINHWDVAIETHNTNHPNTDHALTDLFVADPRRFPTTDILLASPSCTNHSLAKGKQRKNVGQPDLWGTPIDATYVEEERSRCTMWTPLEWAEVHNYRAVIIENVVDVVNWGPFEAWLQAWKGLKYKVEAVCLNSMFAHPTPQSRDRVYFIATKEKNKRPNLKITPLAWCPTCEKDVQSVQAWKKPGNKYGKYKQQYNYCCPSCAEIVMPYYYAAANAIDWRLPIQRIGDRTKELQPKTMQRIAYGLEKFAESPYMLNLSHSANPQSYVHQVGRDPFPAQTTREDLAMVVPYLFTMNHGEPQFTDTMNQPCRTQTSYDATGLIVPPFILDHLGEYRPRDITHAMSTICASGNHHSVVVPPAWLMTYYNNGQMAPIQQAAPTVTTIERHALVVGTPGREHDLRVEDCGFRMLHPDEIKVAMGFPDDYVITGTRRQQVKQSGNAVTPSAMKTLVERVIESLAA